MLAGGVFVGTACFDPECDCSLCSADEKIQQLITTLEMKKDESIERTFKGVAKNFRYSMYSTLLVCV
jgi:hypothetical protein